jgi:hypothetical protein
VTEHGDVIVLVDVRIYRGAGDIDDPHAEMRRTDFVGDRDINYDGTTVLDDITRCYEAVSADVSSA